jgi:hypothetical protein
MMPTVLDAASTGLAVLSAPTLWYCVTALACASILGNHIREGLRLASRYFLTASVLSGRHRPSDLRRVRKQLGARGAYGGLADGRHYVRHGLTEREILRVDRDIADGYFPDDPPARKRRFNGTGP